MSKLLKSRSEESLMGTNHATRLSRRVFLRTVTASLALPLMLGTANAGEHGLKIGQALEPLGMARRQQHFMTSLYPQFAQCATDSTGPDYPDRIGGNYPRSKD